MARFGVPEDCDGTFLEGELPSSADETDYARAVIDLVKTADIPPRFYQNRIFSPHSQDMSSFQKVTNPATRYRLLHREWGKRVSSKVEGSGVMALLTTDDQSLDETAAQRIARDIQALLKGIECDFLRWDQQCLLLGFQSAAEYKQLGEHFMDGHLDTCGGSKVMQLEAAKLTNPPRSLLEISVPKQQGDPTRAGISSFLEVFSASFTHATILEEEGAPADTVPSDSVPSMGVVLFFTPQTQSRAAKIQQILSSPPWQTRSFSEEVSKMENETSFYIHSERALPMWGVRTGAAATGVRLLLLVRDPSKFDAMDEFYRQFTGVTALEHKTDTSALRYSTYSLSDKCEFTLAHYPGCKPCTLDSLAVGFHIRNLNKATGAERLNDDHWLTRDPEGNKVALFSVRR
ncbi:uncharacterized protein [Diadema antillarum]|uniref:uncharacterized protein n=1 Tax=Diadema antillarum TaxID=105358 RepID=UPI003A87534D